MGMHVQVIRGSDFIRVTSYGEVDLDKSRAILEDVAATCKRSQITRALLDLRDLQPRLVPALTPDDLAYLVNAFREMGFSYDQRLALLYNVDPHHRARLFAFIGHLKGWHVKAFGSFENAMDWLAFKTERENGGPLVKQSDVSIPQPQP